MSDPHSSVTVPPLATSDARVDRPSALASLFLVVLSIGVFAPALQYDLVFDDWFLISGNALMAPVAESLGAALEFFGREYWEGVRPDMPEALHPQGQALYRPLTLFLWALVYRYQPTTIATPDAPVWAYHLLNVLLNALVVVLLYRLVLRLTGAGRVAFLCAALFAIHPLHVEVVTYVNGLSDLLAVLAIVLGLHGYLGATDGPRLRVLPLLGMLLAFFLGLLAKELAVLLLAIVPLLDLVAWRAGRPRGGSRLAVYGGLLATLAAHVALRYAVLGYLAPDRTRITHIDNPLIREDLFTRLCTGLKIMGMQLWLFLWPKDLSIDYSFNALPLSDSLGTPETLAALVLFSLLTLWALIKMRRHPALAFAVLLFVGTALFFSNILQPFGTIFGERLTFLPTMGAALAVALLIDALVTRVAGTGPMPAPAAMVLVVLFAALGYRTVTRAHDFRTRRDLWEATARVAPESARVHFNLGAVYSAEQLFSTAEEAYERALEIDPTFLHCAIALGNVHALDRNFEKAVGVYDRIMAGLEGQTGDQARELQRLVYKRRGIAKQGLGDTDGALFDLERAAALAGADPDAESDAQRALAQVQFDRGEFDDALENVRQYLDGQPEDVDALLLLARAAAAVDDPESYEEALARLQMSSDERARAAAMSMQAEALYEQGLLEGDPGKREQALAMFDETIVLNPELATPYVYRGRFFAEQELYFEAIVEFDIALDRQPGNPAALLYKGLAQIAAGRPQDALATAQALEAIQPGVPAYTIMAEAYFALGDLEGMEAAYAKLEEHGESPIEIVLQRMQALANEGSLAEALALAERMSAVPVYADEPRLHRSYGVLLLEAERHDEALAAFERQERAEFTLGEDAAADPFLPVNRARAYLGSGRWAEASAQLDQFALGTDSESRAYPSLLQYRAELALAEGSPFADAEQALAWADEGIERTGGRHPPFYDLAILAQCRLGDVAGARETARRALEAFPPERFEREGRFVTIDGALALALDGDVAGAREVLAGADDPRLQRLAGALGA